VTPARADLRSLRAQAYVILAWGHLSMSGVEDIESLEDIARSAAERLVECFRRSQRSDWPWFESRLTYANAVLPHALFIAAHCWPEEDYLDVAEESFAFLDHETTVDDFFWPVGNSDWYPHGEEKSPYDQQPVEAVTMADAAMAGFTLLGNGRYLTAFRRANAWFHGRNSLRLSLVDARHGSCYDGLQRSGVNRNQGAESTLAYLWAELNNKENAICVENQVPARTRICSIATATIPS